MSLWINPNVDGSITVECDGQSVIIPRSDPSTTGGKATSVRKSGPSVAIEQPVLHIAPLTPSKGGISTSCAIYVERTTPSGAEVYDASEAADVDDLVRIIIDKMQGTAKSSGVFVCDWHARQSIDVSKIQSAFKESERSLFGECFIRFQTEDP